MVSCVYQHFYQECPFGRLDFEDFAFKRMSSGEIFDSEDLASIHAMFQERTPDCNGRSMSSTYEKWVEVVVSSSYQSIPVAINY